MTLKIKLSSLTMAPEAFATQVASHAAAMREYAAHLEGVRADADDEALAPHERRMAFPAPSADPLVERAVAEGYEFEGPTLAEKKAALFAEVRRMETEALAAVVPPAKARHWQFMCFDARARLDKGLATDEDDAALTAEVERAQRQTLINRRAAKIEHDIDDLTDETVDAFVLEPFVG